ncbi:TIGR02206 family membrane protein [Bacillus sp. ISL-47]|uniref:YwaF family protein n=1 Tax=Bacillus sp. ISL-47 TaxID=2819130 RepID=UPI001BE5EEDD|nr:TIGR02206 family membrane protein [Bacillus sp. ISL-47]MBT2689885.1 TIGR02206 family membrane protein [Bacillus sp. ISL-47]MBT2710263.1 TIGR02206 family membrane protein [Pseudomonas sp. ISL-84]
MSGVFSHDYNTFPFIAFTASHLLMIFLFAVVSAIMFIFRGRLRNMDGQVRKIMFFLLFTMELFYHIWLYKGGYWDVTFALPLHLCSISLILCLILLATKSKVVFQIVYFIGIVGALMAILTPELFLGFPHFRYFQFFITHNLIIWTCLYFVFVHNYRPTGKGLLMSILFLNISAAGAFLANKLTDGNYMFLSYKPDNATLLDYFGPYPFYIFSLEGAAILLFIMLLVPFKLKDREIARKEQSS